MTQPEPLQRITSLNPYQPGTTIETLARTYGLDAAKISKLASNENPYGPSNKVKTVIQAQADAVRFYPDQHQLIQAIADRYAIQPENVVLGNGSNDVLDLIARVFLDDTKSAISDEYGFIVYRLVTHLAGAKNQLIPAVKYGHDLDGMLAAITPKTAVIWIANPNNPTGTFLPNDQLHHFVQQVPPHVLVVIDEAYYEYLDPSEQPATLDWLAKHPNIVVVRTFSKLYGLAGLRIGYGIAAPHIIELLNRARQPFNLNTIGLAAATAAIQDKEYAQLSRTRNADGIKQLVTGLKKLSVPILPSYGNFVTIELDDAAAMATKLLKQGIITRQLKEYNLANFLRISVGTPDENQRLLKSLESLLLQ